MVFLVYVKGEIVLQNFENLTTNYESASTSIVNETKNKIPQEVLTKLFMPSFEQINSVALENHDYCISEFVYDETVASEHDYCLNFCKKRKINCELKEPQIKKAKFNTEKSKIFKDKPNRKEKY